MPDQTHYRKLERMYASAPTNAYYHPTLSITAGHADLTVAVRPDFYHSAGAVHGSVYFKLLDDAAYFAVSSLVKDLFVVTVSFTTYFTRPISKGEMRANGQVVYRSRRLYVAESVVVNEKGAEIARGSGTFMPSTIPLTAEVGYA